MEEHQHKVRGAERRGGWPHADSGWTMWKEISGTVIGVLPFVVAFVIWVLTIRDEGRKNTLDIDILKQQRLDMQAQSAQELVKMDNMLTELVAIKIELRAQAIVNANQSVINGQSSSSRH